MTPGEGAGPFLIRRLGAADAEPAGGASRSTRSFGASYEDEVSRSHDWFADRLERNVVIGGWRDLSTLVGVVGLHLPEAVKSSPKGELWAMFVSPEARRTGLATALLARLTRQAASG